MLPPIRFTVTTTWAGPQVTAHDVTARHSHNRSHASRDGRDTDKEWLFERNPVDRRRVSGYLIDHQSRVRFWPIRKETFATTSISAAGRTP